jgi:Tfp pilus assembly protein PilO
MKPYNLYAIFLIITAFLILNFLVLPQYQNWKAVSERVDELEKEAQTQDEYFQQIKEISKILDNNADSLSKIKMALPEGSHLPQLFYFIKNTSNKFGLTFQKIGKIETKETEQPEIKETTAEIILIGDYPALKNFISEIEKSARIIEIEKISFGFSPEEKIKESEKQKEVKNENPIFSFEIKIKVYHY